MLINRAGMMVIPFMSIYFITELHFTIIQTGYILAVFGLGSILGGYIGGRITDRFGFYDLQVFSLLIGGVLFLVMSTLQTFLAITIGIFVLSICTESFRPANVTAIAFFSTELNKTRSYSLNRFAANLGWSVGGSIGGLMAVYNYHILFYIDGVTSVFAALLFFKLIPRKSKVSQITVVKENLPPAKSPYTDLLYLSFVFFTLLYMICFVYFFTMQPVFYKIQWHFAENIIGILMALNGILIIFFEMILVNYLERRQAPLTYIGIGIFLTILAFLCMNLLPQEIWVALTVTGLMTFGEMFCFPFISTFWIQRSVSSNRGAYSGIYVMSYSAALILAPLIGTELVERGGFDLSWWVLSAFCAISLLGIFLIRFINKMN